MLFRLCYFICVLIVSIHYRRVAYAFVSIRYRRFAYPMLCIYVRVKASFILFRLSIHYFISVSIVSIHYRRVAYSFVFDPLPTLCVSDALHLCEGESLIYFVSFSILSIHLPTRCVFIRFRSVTDALRIRSFRSVTGALHIRSFSALCVIIAIIRSRLIIIYFLSY